MAGKTVMILAMACIFHGAVLSAASSMRGAQAGGSDGRWTSAHEVEQSLIDVLSAAALGTQGLGAGTDDFDVQATERALEPLYRVLPKNGHGRLGHSTVRYALHRYFVTRTGMHVKGLDAEGEHWNVSSPVKILEAEVLGFAQHLLEQRLPDGFDLRETAVLAATIEHLLHMEDLHRLRASYEREGLDPEQGASEELTEKVLVTHMVLLPRALEPSEIRNISTADLQSEMETERSKDIVELTRKAFVARKRKGSAPSLSSEQKVSLAEAAQVLKDLWETYGRWENEECKSMQRSLLTKEDKGSGRVKLSDFYDAEGSDGRFLFIESREFLRAVGALDESNPHVPRVIVPNYIGSSGNCMSFSSMRSVCCVLECNDLMGQLEREIGTPTATPERVVEVVSSLSSETVKAPRALSERLVHRLHALASNGQVNVHGRLFAQWMHHAFPRECPYPAKAGEASQAVEATDEVDVSGTVKDLRRLESLPEARTTAGREDLPWSHEEEVLGHHHEKSLLGELWRVVQAVMFSAVLATAAVQIHELYRAVSRASPWDSLMLPVKQKV